MERKQGFFSSLKEDVVRGLSPARSWSRSRLRSKSPAISASPMSGLMRRRRRHHVAEQMIVVRSGEALSPLKEGPDGTDGEDAKMEGKWGHWMKGQLCRAPAVSCSSSAYKRSDLRLLLGVLGAPLGPVHVSTADPFPHLSIKDTPILVGVLIVSCWRCLVQSELL